MSIHNVVEYPEEGFAVLEDDNGKFLMFREGDDIIDIPDSVGKQSLGEFLRMAGRVMQSHTQSLRHWLDMNAGWHQDPYWYTIILMMQYAATKKA